MLIDATYFINEIVIPNRDTQPTLGLITGFIETHEPEFLQKVLGYSFYKEFKAGIEAVSPEQKWKDIRDGADFTDSNQVLQRWPGLLQNSSSVTSKKSVIANYVFYWYQRHAYTQNTSSGEVKAQYENSMATSNNFKMVKAWNDIYLVVVKLHEFLRVNKDTYKGWSESRYHHCVAYFKHAVNDLNI